VAIWGTLRNKSLLKSGRSADGCAVGRDDLQTVLIALLVPMVLLFTPADKVFAEVDPTDQAVASAAPGEFLVAASPEQAAAAGLDVIEEVGFGWTLVGVELAGFQAPTETAAQLAVAFDLVR
jgi:hypothetical protein